MNRLKKAEIFTDGYNKLYIKSDYGLDEIYISGFDSDGDSIRIMFKDANYLLKETGVDLDG